MDTTSDTTDPLRYFRSNMRKRRRLLGYSQTELADAASQVGGRKFHQQTIQKIEDGKRGVPLEDAVQIATALETDLDQLLRSSRGLELTEQVARQHEDELRLRKIALRTFLRWKYIRAATRELESGSRNHETPVHQFLEEDAVETAKDYLESSRAVEIIHAIIDDSYRVEYEDDPGDSPDDLLEKVNDELRSEDVPTGRSNGRSAGDGFDDFQTWYESKRAEKVETDGEHS